MLGQQNNRLDLNQNQKLIPLNFFFLETQIHDSAKFFLFVSIETCCLKNQFRVFCEFDQENFFSEDLAMDSIIKLVTIGNNETNDLEDWTRQHQLIKILTLRRVTTTQTYVCLQFKFTNVTSNQVGTKGAAAVAQ